MLKITYYLYFYAISSSLQGLFFTFSVFFYIFEFKRLENIRNNRIIILLLLSKQNFVEPELRRDFEDFARRMRLKWYFRNEPTPSFSERPSFTPKSSWKPPKGNPSLELFLS